MKIKDWYVYGSPYGNKVLVTDTLEDVADVECFILIKSAHRPEYKTVETTTTYTIKDAE